MRNSIYNSEQARRKVLELYDTQMARLHRPYKDIYIQTSFGRTHVIETGNFQGKPLLVFHGGNATSAYNLTYCDFLFADFHIYAVDTMGHPGKSAETFLSPKNLDYGNWASQVIDQLGYSQIACFGGSFGGGILVKTMCVAPQKVEKSVLWIPAGIKNAPTYKSISMLFPMILYWITHKESWFEKCLLPMAIERDNIHTDLLQTSRCIIDNCKIKKQMPQDEPVERLKKYKNPVMVIAAQKDCLFPGQQVLEKAQRVWKQGVFELRNGKGHIHDLTARQKKQIHDFLLQS